LTPRNHEVYQHFRNQVKGARMKRFLIHNFGCQMNVLDSERIEDLLLADGWFPASSEQDADLIIFNTCCVRGSAEERALGRLTTLKPWRLEREDRILALCGCIAQKDGAVLLQRFSFLDLVIGTRDYAHLPEILEDILQTGKRGAFIDGIADERIEISAPRRGAPCSFVTIMYGCNNYCSYCIVPYVRGPEVSRSPADIVAEISTLAAMGTREITLLGQNVNSYRAKEFGLDFPGLLHLICREVPDLARIRFTTSHPRDASDQLIRAVADLPAVCEQFHIPAQSGSDHVLRRMNRGYSADDYRRLVARIRNAIPRAVITTDLLVGFPGETREDFRDTLRLTEEVQWDSAFTFIYSIRPGTAAAGMPDDVPLEVKRARVAELIMLQESISAEKNRAFVGSTVEVLAERVSRRNPGDLAGRDRGGRTVVFPGEASLIGTILPVTVFKTTPHTLAGETAAGGEAGGVSGNTVLNAMESHRHD